MLVFLYLGMDMSPGQVIPAFANQGAEKQEQPEMPEQQVEAKSFWWARVLSWWALSNLICNCFCGELWVSVVTVHH